MLYRYRRIGMCVLCLSGRASSDVCGDFDNFITRATHSISHFCACTKTGMPLRPNIICGLADKPPAAGDLVVAVGHPASTQRGLTVAQRQFHRDTKTSFCLEFCKKRIAAIDGHYMAQGMSKLDGSSLLRHLEKTPTKRLSGQQEGLRDVAPDAEASERRGCAARRGTQTEKVWRRMVPASNRVRKAWSAEQTCLCDAFLRRKCRCWRCISVRALIPMRSRAQCRRLESSGKIDSCHGSAAMLSSAPLYTQTWEEVAVLVDWMQSGKAHLNADPLFVQALLSGQTSQVAAILEDRGSAILKPQSTSRVIGNRSARRQIRHYSFRVCLDRCCAKFAKTGNDVKHAAAIGIYPEQTAGGYR